MKKPLKNLVMLAAVLAILPHLALADEKLAQSKACTACHAVDKKLVGPAYQEVAKKYAGDKDAVNKLVANIKSGGTGKWGPVPMPAQPSLSDAEVKTLATWILGLAKK
ncbi:MAG: c-type cytochrome [Gammaproteobacteria bacterium]|nr:c-type cytochrome [Gammaproteobacteria bacterium]